MRIKLDRDEVFKLLSHGDILQQIAIEHGMPSFRSSYLKVSDYNFFNFGKYPVSLERIVRFIQNNLNQDPDIFDFFESYMQKIPCLKDLKNISRLSVLLEESQVQDIDFDEIKSLIGLLKDEQLNVANLQLNAVRLRRVINELEQNLNNGTEKFFQDFLTKNSFILPFVIPTLMHSLDDVIYVGGKNASNSGGKYPDFVYSSGMTNISIVEIKTATTPLVGKTTYRGDVYPVSSEITGAVIQGKVQKDALLKNFFTVAYKSVLHEKNVNDPDVFIIAGCYKDLIDDARKNSFDQFRNGLKDVRIMTFDEIIEKLKLVYNTFSAE